MPPTVVDLIGVGPDLVNHNLGQDDGDEAERLTALIAGARDRAFSVDSGSHLLNGQLVLVLGFLGAFYALGIVCSVATSGPVTRLWTGSGDVSQRRSATA